MKRELQRHTVTGSQVVASECLVCGKDNPNGFHTQFLNLDDGRVAAVMTPCNDWQSYPDRLHGGVTCAILDELLGRVTQIDNPWELAVTVELNVKYRSPVPLDKEVHAVAWLVKDHKRLFDAAGEIVLEDGTIAAEATGRYLRTTAKDFAGQGENADFLYEDPRPYPESILI